MYINNIDVNKLNEILYKIENLAPSPDNIDTVTSWITNLLNDSSQCTFNNNVFITNDRNKPWFGNNCKKARKKYHAAKNNYTNDKSTYNKN